MFPILFQAGRVPVGTHDAFVFLGVTVATLLFFYEGWRRRMLSVELFLVAGGTLLSGAVAAKASVAWRYFELVPDATPLGAFLYAGKSILGGLAGAYAGALVTKRLLGYRERTGDLFAPAVAAGMAIGRWGCFLTERVGTPTSLPWGITVDEEAARRVPGLQAGVPLHPSFVYEIAFHLAAFLAIWWLRPRVAVKGDLFKGYLLAYAVFRFFVEFVRGNPALLFGLSGSQLFLIPSTVVLLAYFARQVRTRAYEVPSPGPCAQPEAIPASRG